MSFPTKAATCIVIDVSPTMTPAEIKQAKTIAATIIETGLLTGGSGDLFGLVLAGTKETDDDLGYENILIKESMRRPDLDFLRSVEEIDENLHQNRNNNNNNDDDDDLLPFVAGNNNNNNTQNDRNKNECIDSLLVGTQTLLKVTKGKRFQRFLIYLTNAAAPLNPDATKSVPPIIEALRTNFISLQLIGFGFNRKNFFDPGLLSTSSIEKIAENPAMVTPADLDRTEQMGQLPVKERNERGLRFIVGESMKDVSDSGIAATTKLREDYQQYCDDNNIPQNERYPHVNLMHAFPHFIMNAGETEVAQSWIHSADFEEAHRTTILDKKTVASRATSKLPLKIGPDCAIAGSVLLHTTETTSGNPTFKRLTSKGEKIETVRRHFTLFDVDKELDEKDRIKAYRYGRSFIPACEIDEAQLKFKSTKGLELVAFIPLDQIKEHSLMGPVRVFAPMKNDAVGLQFMRTFCSSLCERRQGCLMRFVYRDNSEPQLVVAIPRAIDDEVCSYYFNSEDAAEEDREQQEETVKAHHSALIFACLPFNEDMRNLRFPDFSNHKCRPDKLKAVNDMVDAMTNHGSRGYDGQDSDTIALQHWEEETEKQKQQQQQSQQEQNDEIEREEQENFFHPNKVFNPSSQLFYHMVRTKLREKKDLFVPVVGKKEEEGDADDQNNNNQMMMMNGNENQNQLNKKNDEDDDDDDDIPITTTNWSIPVNIKRNCCSWGQNGNVLEDFFARTFDKRKQVRQMFNSFVDMNSKSLTQNKRGQQAGGNDDHDGDNNMMMGGNFGRNNNNNNNQQWVLDTTEDLRQKRLAIEQEQNKKKTLDAAAAAAAAVNNNNNMSLRDGTYSASSASHNNNNNNQHRGESSSSLLLLGEGESLPTAQERYGGNNDLNNNNQHHRSSLANSSAVSTRNQSLARNFHHAGNSSSSSKIISSSDPLGTFKNYLLQNNNNNNNNNNNINTIFRTACDHLSMVIVEDLLKQGSIAHTKIQNSLDEMRVESLKFEDATIYNDTLVAIKNKCNDLYRMSKIVNEHELQQQQQQGHHQSPNNKNKLNNQQQNHEDEDEDPLDLLDREFATSSLPSSYYTSQQRRDSSITSANNNGGVQHHHNENNSDNNNNNNVDFTRSENDFYKTYIKTQRVCMISQAECQEGGKSVVFIQDFLGIKKMTTTSSTSANQSSNVGSAVKTSSDRQQSSVSSNNNNINDKNIVNSEQEEKQENKKKNTSSPENGVALDEDYEQNDGEFVDF